MATVFDKILDTTTGPKSYDWYKKQVQSMTRQPGARSLINQGKATVAPKYGIMNLFAYDPKFKQTLPYYDRFPLIFPIDFAKGGFYGINFHYLQPGARVNFLRQLSRFASDKKFDSKTRYNIGNLSGRYYKKTIKHYLYSQVRSSFLNITAEEMAIAIFLPVARFEKGRPY
tara:strand:- start:45 stop:557 length:513 start_codon:yes stop_codon:yes gene_type:complete